MKPKLTIAVRRGLQSISMLAGADIEADQSEECPAYTGQSLADIEKAFHWIACLEVEKPALLKGDSYAAAMYAACGEIG